VQTANWNIDDFRAWLAGQLPEENVGVTCSSANCPLAHWRQALGEQVCVEPHIAIEDDGRKFALPIWAQTFVRHIDDRYLTTDNGYDEAPITAHECLDELDGVKATA
jgi:hypothetical protein